MRIRQCFVVACVAALMPGAFAATVETDQGTAADDPEILVKAKSRRFDALHLLPGADFRGYTKVMLDPAPVAYAEGWRRDVNQTMDLMRRTTTGEAKQIAEQAGTDLGRIFASAFARAGYAVVTTPGADVLRLSPRIVDFRITAPENLTTSPRTRVYAADAGEATLVLRFHDSMTGALLGRVVDRRTAGDRGDFGNRARLRPGYPISTVSNRSDFDVLFGTWARLSIETFAELKAQSPVAPVATAPEP